MRKTQTIVTSNRWLTAEAHLASSHLFFTFGSARAAPTSKSLKKIQTKKFRQKNSDEKIPTKKFRRKNLDEKKWTKKNWGQGTGARHGRCGGKARVINGDSWGAKPPRPPPGGKARVTEIPGGASPPRPPHDTISKNLPFRGKFFEMKKTAPPPQTAPRKNSAEHAVPRGSARRRVAENGGAIFKIVPLNVCPHFWGSAISDGPRFMLGEGP